MRKKSEKKSRLRTKGFVLVHGLSLSKPEGVGDTYVSSVYMDNDHKPGIKGTTYIKALASCGNEAVVAVSKAECLQIAKWFTDAAKHWDSEGIVEVG